MKPATKNYETLVKVAVIAAFSVGAASCGGSKAQVGTPAPTTANALTGSNCTKDKCPPADINVFANFAASGLMVGFTGEPVEWKFNGFDKNTVSEDGLTSDRKVVVLLNDVPKGSNIFPDKNSDLSSEARIDWLPEKLGRGKMEFIARDYERCVLEKDKETCNKYIYLKEYDRRFAGNSWEIMDKDTMESAAAEIGSGAENVVNVSNPNCGNPTTNGAITQSVLQVGLKVLTGGGLGAILPSLAGSLIGGGAASSGVNPTEC